VKSGDTFIAVHDHFRRVALGLPIDGLPTARRDATDRPAVARFTADLFGTSFRQFIASRGDSTG